MRPSAVPNRSHPRPERIGGRKRVLAREEQQRDVVRGAVGERDRDHRRDVATRVGAGAASRYTAASERETASIPSARRRSRQPKRGPKPRSATQPVIGVVCSSQVGPALMPSKVTVPIITITTATVPAAPRAGEPAQERAQPQHAAAQFERREPREQPEVDRERLAAARPRLDAVERHREPRQHRVDDVAHAIVRAVTVRRDQLEPREGQQARRRRPKPEARGVRQRLQLEPPERRADDPPDRAPGVERTEHVTEQRR